MTKKFVECEYKPGEELVLRFKPMDLPMMNDAAKEHLRTASKEFLMAMRSLVDAAIDFTAHTEASKGEAKTKIEVR